MARDLALAQRHAFALARTLMVPVTLFRSGNEFGAYLNSQAVSLAFR